MGAIKEGSQMDVECLRLGYIFMGDPGRPPPPFSALPTAPPPPKDGGGSDGGHRGQHGDRHGLGHNTGSATGLADGGAASRHQNHEDGRRRRAQGRGQPSAHV